MNNHRKRYDDFRDKLAVALKYKMKAEKYTVRSLAAELGLAISSVSQLRQGSAGTDRNVPSLEKHFLVFEWMGALIGEFEPHDTERIESTIRDVHDVVMRLDMPLDIRNQIAEVIQVLWEVKQR